MMPQVDLKAIAAANNTLFTGVNLPVNGIKIDSRKIETGDVFIAIKGENFDGHDFIESAEEKGAIAAVVEVHKPINIPQIIVENTLDALANIAKINCSKFKGKIAAITGSSGKTTCKNMLKAILSVKGSVCYTKGNFNNEIGLPLTAQQLSEHHEYAVFEMGASKTGDIDFLAKIAKPNVCAITNISEAHIESFGTLENTADTKGEIFNYLDNDGWAIINLDDVFSHKWIKNLKIKKNQIITFSAKNKNANIFSSDISFSKKGITFDVNINLNDKFERLTINLNLLGYHNILNSLLAISMAKALGIDNKEIIIGLSKVNPEKGRLMLSELKDNIFIIDDSYNANPRSMHAAIDTLSSFSILNKLHSILIISDMAELGKESFNHHFEIGKFAAIKDIKNIFVTGNHAKTVIEGYKKNGGCFSEEFFEKKDLVKKINLMDLKSSVILVKGSRSTNMDELVSQIVDLEI